MQDGMIDRFMRSCQLAKASWDVLRADRELLLLPVLSIVATALALLVWAATIRAAGIPVPKAHAAGMLQAMRADPALFASFFIAYLFMIFIGLFFNTALVGAALQKLQGGNPTVGSALALASRRAGAIFGYAVVSATVGMLMAMIVERLGGVIGRLFGLGIGFAWTVATFLVVPILAAEGAGPIRAIEESTGLLRRTWGENLIGNVGISLAMSAVTAVIMIAGFASGLTAARHGHAELVAPIFAGTVFLFLVSALVGFALRGIYVAAVYYYAVAGTPPWGFAPEALQGAFRRKGQ